MRMTVFRVGQVALFASVALAKTTAATASVQQYRCSNQGIDETQCARSGCNTTETHTPVQVTVDAGNVTVCAYSACREGEPDLWALNGDHLIASAVLRTAVRPSDPAERATVVVDTRDGFATLKWMGFVQPMRCSAGPAAQLDI